MKQNVSQEGICLGDTDGTRVNHLCLPVCIFFGQISSFEALRPFLWTAMALQAFGKPH